MNWINIEVKTLRSPEYIGSDPVERATWLNLMAYCCEQENGGKIKGCREWGDRRWMQTCGITKAEAELQAELWEWFEDDLVIWAYPISKEAEVKAKRIAGAKGGKASRPPKTKAVKAVLEAELEADPKLSSNGKERKGIGIEEKKESLSSKRKGSEADCKAYAKELGLPETDGTWFFDSMEAGGWTRGGKPLKDWKAHLRSYKQQGWLPSLKNAQPQTRSGEKRDGEVMVEGKWRKVKS